MRREQDLVSASAFHLAGRCQFSYKAGYMSSVSDLLHICIYSPEQDEEEGRNDNFSSASRNQDTSFHVTKQEIHGLISWLIASYGGTLTINDESRIEIGELGCVTFQRWMPYSHPALLG